MDFYDCLVINDKDAANDIIRITKNFGERLQLQFETAEKLENETIAEKEAFGIEEIDDSEDTSKQLAWLKVTYRNLNIIDIYAKKKSDQNFHQPWKQSCFDKTKISKFINLPKSDQSVIEQYPNQKTKLPNLIRTATGCRIEH
uniref:Uncharacterized protein n=1 Tax=Panagrolaimus davidi TaxID=227884 RepID=A0A914PNR5_9BILA